MNKRQRNGLVRAIKTDPAGVKLLLELVDRQVIELFEARQALGLEAHHD